VATPANGEKELQKRKTAGVKRKAVAVPATEGDTQVEADPDRRGKLPRMRQQLAWSDGCGVQYVQREAALGTAAMYGDIEALARQATSPAERFGVFGRHVVFEPHCFKCRDIHMHMTCMACAWHVHVRVHGMLHAHVHVHAHVMHMHMSHVHVCEREGG
jgi:hypothetical protein